MSMDLHPMDEYNERLISHTHPPEWDNHEPNNPYNMVVVGAGTAGLVAAAGAAQLGARTALIEKGLMGGDCLNYGCIPSKSLIRCATALDDTLYSGRFNVIADGKASINFSGVMERMRRLRSEISRNDSAGRLSANTVNVFLGEAKFTGPDTLEVKGKELRFSRAIIATGARAAIPSVKGLEETGYLTNETLFNITEQPARLAVIGAGPLGCEMAQTFQRLGSRVVILETADQVLVKEDPDAADALSESLKRDGVRLQLAINEIIEVKRVGNEKIIVYQNKESDSCESAAVDEILISTGRRPCVEGLGLEDAGVKFDTHSGIEVDDNLRTTNTRIFAAGDVCSRFQFTHAADFLARTALANALFPVKRKASALIIPRCTFTDPQVAHAGITERDAAESHIPVDTFKVPMDNVDRAILDGETEGFVKILVKQGKDRILGATIVARNAGDMIGEIVLAMNHKIGLGSISNVIHPYPTQAEAIRKAGDHYNRTRITPFIRKVLNRWMAWNRKG